MFDNKVLIENIRILCDKHDIKITNLEKELGFGAGIINRWGNDADPSLSKIVQISNYFNVSLDDVVGYGNIVNDRFIEKLIFQTTNKIIQWNCYNNISECPKQYYGFLNLLVDDFNSKEEYDNFIEFHKEISYYTKINNGYFSIYGQYNGNNVTKPIELKLFIQPTINSELISQDEYTIDQLIPLWLKILYTLNNDAPDEIKAAAFKYSYLNEYKVDINDKQFKNAELSSTDFSGANLCFSNFSGADLRGVNLNKADLSGANLKGAILKGAKLENIILGEEYKIINSTED